MSDDLLPYFLAEGRELTERVGEALFDLDRGVGPAEAIERAFRAIHTLKGSTGLFDMSELGALLHAAESELEAARGRDGAISADQISALNECNSETERWIEALEAQGSVPQGRRRAAAALEARLRGATPSGPQGQIVPATPPNWARDLVRVAGLPARAAVQYAPDSEAYFRGEDPLAIVGKVPDLLWLELDRRPSEADTPFACDLVLRALSGAPPEAVAAALRLAGDQAEVVALEASAASQSPAPRATRTVRVEAASLDAASDLLDQLIIAKNALAHETAATLGERADDAKGIAGAQLALDRAATALHSAVGRMRLAPLRRLFAPLPRQVREMADVLGKQVELAITGEEVAVDKAIMDGLYEPLIHTLRNAVDHGVEAPSVRLAAGKPARATIRLAAAPRGDVAVIEVADDGAGLDLARIRQIAAERGLISPADAEALSDRQAAELIFMPGFSTARAVTGLSGRGVGLDAVRAALARIGGRVEVETHPGQGAVVRMTAPLRTLLVRIAVFCVGTERFGAPLDTIREVVRIPRAAVTAVRSGEAVMVRDEVIPLMHLAELLGRERSCADPLIVAVIQQADGRVGLAVDRVAESLQAPVQAISPLLGGLAGLRGSVLQADGRILLLLDLRALTQ
jgi:two-component system chemotaxis sensor kinase CheA